MISKSRSVFAAFLLAGVAPAALVPGVAAAQSADQRSFDIPAQSLEAALLAYMRQSGVQVGYEPGDVAAQTSAPVSGTLSSGDALSRMLNGTGLIYRSTGGTAVRLQRLARTGDGATQLGPVRVQGQSGTVSASAPMETATGPVPGYRATLSATATRTDTAIRDVPQSIQVVPRTVIEDQAAVRLTDVVQNVSSVQLNGTAGNRAETYNIRGFVASRYAINGFALSNAAERPEAFLDLANVERVEVLKGPASVMVGLTDPGGVINIVTREPSKTFSFNGAFQGGSFDFYRGELSVSGPLNASGTLSARATGAIQTDGGFRDQARDSERVFGAGALRWEPDALTRVDLTVDYLDSKQPFDRGLYADANGNYPHDAGNFLGERWSTNSSEKLVVGLAAQRQVVPWLMLRVTGRYTDATSFDSNGVDLQGLEADNRTLRRRVTTRTEAPEDLTMRFEALADAFTGGIEHRIMVGAEHNRGDFRFRSARANIGTIDIYEPVYGTTPVPVTRENANYDYEARNWGFYIQDQISLGEQWKALVGLRYDRAKSYTDDVFNDEVTRTDVDALTWRAGLVYQPTTAVSLYASYTRSFIPQQGQTVDLAPLDPEKGEQFKAGVKLDLIPNALSLTGAVFQITKQNVATEDPADADFSILTGEQRVRGVEFDMTGDILPGWSIIANVSYLDTEIARDNVFAVGNRLTGVPELSGRLWTSYSVRQGALKGLSAAGGIRVVDKRQIDLDNSFTIAGYHTFDASVRYALDEHWELSVNAQNLTDKFYIEGVQSESNLYPGTPRRITGTIRARF
jgi:iron complex outermembrane receptor protein